MIIRYLTKNDLNSYLCLINTFRNIDLNTEIQQLDFFYDKIMEKGTIIIIEEDKIIIGTITVFIEYKFIHNLSKVCHIEDLIILPEFKGKGLGKQLVEKAIEYAKHNNCYKIILNTNEELVEFYEKCGFTKQNLQMELRF